MGRKNKVIEDKILEDVGTPYETDEENYYEPIKIKGAFKDNYTE